MCKFLLLSHPQNIPFKFLNEYEFDVEGTPEKITISAGVAAWPDHGSDLESVIRVANEAEHKAKKAGKNRIELACVLNH